MRNRRGIFRVVLCSGVLAILALVLSLDTVDYRPYQRQPFYLKTMERLRTEASSNRVVRGELLAGFGRARLTPEIGAAVDQPAEGKFHEMPLAGYGARKGHPATGVHDDLFVKAVALRVGGLTGIIFAADALIVPREIADAAAQQLRAEFGLSREQLYFSATHTHSGMGGWGEGLAGEAFAGKFNPDSRIWFADRFVTAARQALSNLQPAEFGHATFQEPRLVRNRVLKEGTVDTDFAFLVVRQTGGQTAVIGSYPAHATVLPASNLEFSGDYPGYWEREIERATGGYALFVAGSLGSHAPLPGESGFKGAERMGQLLANPVIEKLKQVPLTNVVSFGIIGLNVSLPDLNVRVTDSLRLRLWLSRQLLHPPGTGTFLQAFRIDDAIWISTPCDFSGELAIDIKNLLKVRGYTANITSFNGDYIGYVIRSRYYHMNGYEPRLMSFYGPYTSDYLDELIRALALSLAQ